MPAHAISRSKPEPKSAAYGHVCVDCAKAKVKCFPREGGGCVRCHRRGQTCTAAVPARRLGAKRSSSAAASPARSSRLEGKLDHLVDLIRSQQAAHGSAVAAATTGSSQGTPISQSPAQHPPYVSPGQDTTTNTHVHAQTQGAQHYGNHNRQHLYGPTPAATTISSSVRGGPPLVPESPLGFSRDDCELTYMTPEQALQCLDMFRTGYMMYLPFVHLPPGTDPAQIQQDRPFLWLSIQAICARPPSKQLRFGDLVREVLAKQYVVLGERSLDLLLGCLIYLAWAQLFNRGRPLTTMMSHIARALTYDLRINQDLPDEAITGSVFAKSIEIARPAPSHEVRRALLGCFITSSVTTSFVRIAPLSWSVSMEEAAQHLRERPESPNDEMLVAIASARRIIDETSLLNKLHVEDPVGFGSFTAHIPSLRHALQAERERLPLGLRGNHLLALHFDQVEVCIYELALLAPPAPTPTVPPSRAAEEAPSTSSSSGPTASASSQRHQDPSNNATTTTTSTTTTTTTNSLLSSARINTRRLGYLTSCLDAAKRCLDHLLSLEASDYLYMPFSVIMQALYSLQTLNRLALVDGVAGWERSEVREVADGLEYTRRVEAKLRQAGEILKEQSRRFRESADGGGAGGVGMGKDSHRAGQEDEEESSFTRGAELLQKTVEAWSMVLNAKSASKKAGGSRLEVDFQCVDFTIGKRVDRNAGSGGSGSGGGGGGGGASFDNILNHQDPADDVQMGNDGVAQQMPYIPSVAVDGVVPIYNHPQQQQQQQHLQQHNPYASTTASLMPDSSAMYGGMNEQLMYPGMPDYTWMSAIMGYWEL